MDLVTGQHPLYDAAAACSIDAYAIDSLGIAGSTLMRAAAAATERVVRGRFAQAHAIVVVAGSGNNAGDGYEVARLLCAHGRSVRIVRVSISQAQGDAAQMLQGAIAAGVPVDERPDGAIADLLTDSDLVIDALLGSGATGAPRDGIAEAIRAVNDAALPVVALDIPSGVDASTGETPGLAIHADITISFHCDKLGLRIAPGCAQTGVVIVVPIGIPGDLPIEPSAVAVTDAAALLPGRLRGGSKYDAGAVLVVGGSVGMAGAPALTAAAALRAGAGAVTALVPEAIQTTVASGLREVMVRPLASLRPERQIAEYAERARAVVLGPGLGREPEVEAIVRAVLALERPVLVDADALWWVARDPSVLQARRAPTIITPHSGEAARLLGCDAAQIEQYRLRSVRELVELTRAVTLLKGRDTLVLAPDGRLGLRAQSSAALATAGSGDVLAGIIGACLARGADPWTAAIAGAAAHVQAAMDATGSRRDGGIIAGDLIEHLSVLALSGSPS